MRGRMKRVRAPERGGWSPSIACAPSVLRRRRGVGARREQDLRTPLGTHWGEAAIAEFHKHYKECVYSRWRSHHSSDAAMIGFVSQNKAAHRVQGVGVSQPPSLASFLRPRLGLRVFSFGSHAWPPIPWDELRPRLSSVVQRL